jgi:hypothetical protein
MVDVIQVELIFMALPVATVPRGPAHTWWRSLMIRKIKIHFFGRCSGKRSAPSTWRRAYARPAAHYEHNGIPVNVDRYKAIEARRSELQVEIVEAKNGYGVYAIEGTKKNPRQKAVFKMKKFVALLERLGILESWPKTETEQPRTDDEEVFEPMAKLHPYLEDLRQAKKSLNDLGRFGSYLGKDGFNRAALWAFGTVTGATTRRRRRSCCHDRIGYAT